MNELSNLLSRPQPEGRKQADYWFIGGEMDGDAVKRIAAAVAEMPYVRTGLKSDSKEIGSPELAEAHIRERAEAGEPVSFVTPTSRDLGFVHEKAVLLSRAITACDLRAVTVRIDGDGEVEALGVRRDPTPEEDLDEFERHGATDRTGTFRCGKFDCRPMADTRQIEEAREGDRLDDLLERMRSATWDNVPAPTVTYAPKP